jgi:hypothetical protein
MELYEWNTVTASYNPGDCPALVLTMLISIQTDLIALLFTMNDCRVSMIAVTRR